MKLPKALLAALGLVTAAITVPSMAEARKITYASFLSGAHPVHIALDRFFERVTQATNGSLTFKSFPGGTMGGAKALLGLVRDGVVNSAFINASYTPSNLPAGSSLISLFGPDTMPVAGADNETQLFNCPSCVKELQEFGVKPLAYYATASYALMCTKPIPTLEDIRGRKIRTAGGYNFLAVKLGGVPVQMDAGELYEGMQRGQLDCVLGAPGWLKSYNLSDMVKGIVDLPLGVFHGIAFYNMRQSVWDELSAAEKKAIIGNLAQLVRDVSVLYVAENDEARKIAAEKGITYHKPDPRIEGLLAEHIKNENDRVIAKAKKDGVTDAEAMLKAYSESVDRWQKIVAEGGRDPDKFQQALQERIFSKLAP